MEEVYGNHPEPPPPMYSESDQVPQKELPPTPSAKSRINGLKGVSPAVILSNQAAQSGIYPTGSTVTLHCRDLVTPSGVLMIINMVLLFFSWCIITAWKSNGRDYATSEKRNAIFYDEMHFFLSAATIPFFITLVIILLILCGMHNKVERGHRILTLMIHSTIWSIILMIASIMLAVKVKDHKDNNGSVPKNWCTVWECHTLNAGYAFGFLASLGLGVQAGLHFLEFIRNKSSITIDCCC